MDNDNQEQITKVQLGVIEKSLDKLFGKLGMDIEFTKHFLDRLNDPRNKKQITPAELIKVYNSLYDKYGIEFSHTEDEIDRLIHSISTNINIPVQIVYNRKTKKIDIIAKTVMRVNKFFSKSPEVVVEKTFKRFLNIS